MSAALAGAVARPTARPAMALALLIALLPALATAQVCACVVSLAGRGVAQSVFCIGPPMEGGFGEHKHTHALSSCG